GVSVARDEHATGRRRYIGRDKRIAVRRQPLPGGLLPGGLLPRALILPVPQKARRAFGRGAWRPAATDDPELVLGPVRERDGSLGGGRRRILVRQPIGLFVAGGFLRGAKRLCRSTKGRRQRRGREQSQADRQAANQREAAGLKTTGWVRAQFHIKRILDSRRGEIEPMGGPSDPRTSKDRAGPRDLGGKKQSACRRRRETAAARPSETTSQVARGQGMKSLQNQDCRGAAIFTPAALSQTLATAAKSSPRRPWCMAAV